MYWCFDSYILLFCFVFFSFFFFKQKTAYEMRISDWSSDVCSSDLRPFVAGDPNRAQGDSEKQWRREVFFRQHRGIPYARKPQRIDEGGEQEIGRASCRERVCEYV